MGEEEDERSKSMVMQLQQLHNNNNKSSSSSSSSSPASSCPICLGPIIDESFLDRCFHMFCYKCILHWTKVVATKHSNPPSSVKCPLCKTDNFSIIHEYDGISLQRHYVNQGFGNSSFFSKAHKYRLQCYYIESGTLLDKFNVSSYWKFRRYLKRNHWLPSWLTRELQALIQEEDVDIIVHHVVGMIDSLRRKEHNSSEHTPETKQEEFKALVSQAARPFLTGRTDRFVIELERFLASGLNIEAYDRVYIRHLGWKIPEITGEDMEGELHDEHQHLVPSLNLFDEDFDMNE